MTVCTARRRGPTFVCARRRGLRSMSGHPAYAWGNPPTLRRSAQYLLDYAKRTGAKILYGHDMAQFETLIKSHQGYYD